MANYRGKRTKWFFAILAPLLLLLFITDLLFGTLRIPAGEIVNILFTGTGSQSDWELILLNYRLPKALAAILSGIALSISGLQMQAIFRNPLAGPDVLGINAGAGLGVAIVVLSLSGITGLEFANISGHWLIAISACLGAAAVLLIIMAVSARVSDIMAILIIGIMIGTGISAFTGILQYFGNATLLKSFILWTMGSLSQTGHEQNLVMFLLVLAGSLLSVVNIKKLNVLLMGEKYAISMGINIKLTRLLVFISTSLLAGSITAFCGPIAFVAIAVPHLCRIILKSTDHVVLWIACFLAGPAIMLFSDILAQLPGTALSLPINSVTSLIGIPVVVLIVARNHKKKLF